MQAIAEEVQLIIAATLLLFLITSFVVGFIFIHHHQHRKYRQEKEELKSMYQQEILKAQLEMREQTLNFISQEIHDNIGQILSLVKLNLNTLSLDTPQLSEKVGTTKNLVSQAIVDLRNLSKSLNTNHIYQQRLSELIQLELKLIEKTGQYETNFTAKGNEVPLDHQKQLIIFRITQEILNNIIKHAQAARITVELNFCEQLKLIISDDGSGFAPSLIRGGTGINNMKYRAKLIEATLEIESAVDKGTNVVLTLYNYT